MEYHCLLVTEKFLVWTFGDGKYGLFEPKSWWKDDIYWIQYRKVLVLNFSERGNTVFFWAKMLMESWYLLGLFELSKIFQDLENMVFHAALFDNDSGDKLLRFITRAIKKAWKKTCYGKNYTKLWGRRPASLLLHI